MRVFYLRNLIDSASLTDVYKKGSISYPYSEINEVISGLNECCSLNIELGDELQEEIIIALPKLKSLTLYLREDHEVSIDCPLLSTLSQNRKCIMHVLSDTSLLGFISTHSINDINEEKYPNLKTLTYRGEEELHVSSHCRLKYLYNMRRNGVTCLGTVPKLVTLCINGPLRLEDKEYDYINLHTCSIVLGDWDVPRCSNVDNLGLEDAGKSEMETLHYSKLRSLTVLSDMKIKAEAPQIYSLVAHQLTIDSLDAIPYYPSLRMLQLNPIKFYQAVEKTEIVDKHLSYKEIVESGEHDNLKEYILFLIDNGDQITAYHILGDIGLIH